MSPLRLAAAQMGPASEHKADNVARIESLLADAGRLMADFVVLPELSLSPYFPKDAEEDADRWSDDPSTSPHVQRIAAAIKRARVVCVLPLAERYGQDLYNSALIIDRDGSLCGTYQKTHIPGGRSDEGVPLSGEAIYFAEGRSGFQVFDTAVGRVGVIICADRGYPEAWRVLGLRGAQIVAAPFNTSVQVPHDASALEGSVTELRRIQHLRMAAAALTNGFFVVAAGKGGVERGVEYLADSQIIDAWGHIRARATSHGDELIVGEVALERELRDRDVGRQLSRRRPEFYSSLTKKYLSIDSGVSLPGE